jgi:hypothetical protein
MARYLVDLLPLKHLQEPELKLICASRLSDLRGPNTFGIILDQSWILGGVLESHLRGSVCHWRPEDHGDRASCLFDCLVLGLLGVEIELIVTEQADQRRTDPKLSMRIPNTVQSPGTT